MNKAVLYKLKVPVISSFLAIGLSTGFSAYAYAPSVSFAANPSTISQGEAVAMVWSSTSADYCVASGGWGGYKFVNGAYNIYPSVTTEYAISCVGQEGTVSARVSVTVTNAPTPIISSSPPSIMPAVSIVITPNIINKGSSATLVWNSSGTTACYATNGWSGTKSTSGSQVVTPLANTTYTIVCTSGGNSASDSKTLVVTEGQSSIFAAACVTSPNSAKVGREVLFAAGSSGGTGPVTYQWTGDISGNGLTRSVSFPTAGTKTAAVIATDSLNKVARANCNAQIIDSIVITAVTTTSKKPVAKPANKEVNQEGCEAVCRAKGYVKPGVELTSKNSGTEKNTDEKNNKKGGFLGYLAFGGGGMPPGLGLFILMVATILITFGATLIFQRFTKKKVAVQ